MTFNHFNRHAAQMEHLPSIAENLPKGSEQPSLRPTVRSTGKTDSDFGGNLARLPKRKESSANDDHEAMDSQVKQTIGTFRVLPATHSSILVHQSRAAIIVASQANANATIKVADEGVSNLPSPPRSLKRSILLKHRNRNQIQQSIHDLSTIPPALLEPGTSNSEQTPRTNKGLRGKLQETLSSATQLGDPEPRIPLIIIKGEAGNSLTQSTLKDQFIEKQNTYNPAAHDEDVVVANDSLRSSYRRTSKAAEGPSSLIMSSDDLANSGKRPPQADPMLALLRGQDESPNAINNGQVTELTPPSQQTIKSESLENTEGNLVAGSPSGPKRANRPKSAHSDYEKYVRQITGHYLKERYSDHIKVSTKMILGRGAFGVVYSGVNEKTGQIVAVKHMPIDAQRQSAVGGDVKRPTRPLSASPSHKELLRATQIDECFKSVVEEIRLMAQLKHPNIVQYYHAEIVGSRWEDVYERRHHYLTQQRRRVQKYERSMVHRRQGAAAAALSPLSPLLSEDESLPPMDPPHPDLTAPPAPTGIRYLVICMEYMSGGSLGGLMAKMIGDKAAPNQKAPSGAKKERQPPKVIAFSEKMIRIYFKQVLSGLAYLHEHRIVHRDIKADNLLLSASDGIVRISDFGTSRKFADVSALGCSAGNDDGEGSGQRALMTLTGTPSFMAPEMVKGSGHSYPADIWSIGATVIHLLTGQAPFEQYGQPWTIMYKISEEPEKIIESIPDDASILMKDFILKCVAPDPPDRWTAVQLLLHPFITEEEEDGYYSSEEEEEATDD